jgi:hypothetical protein
MGLVTVDALPAPVLPAGGVSEGVGFVAPVAGDISPALPSFRRSQADSASTAANANDKVAHACGGGFMSRGMGHLFVSGFTAHADANRMPR